jgi:hypothetical protein
MSTLGAASSGCAEQDPFNPSSASSSGSGGQGGVGGAEVNLGEQMFRELEADFVSECASCHKVGGSADTPFLGDPETGNPDPYDAVTSWPGAITADPKLSVITSWPNEGLHTGPPPSSDLEARLEAWLAEEAKAVEAIPNDSKTIPPFKPIVPGFNAVYLDPLGSDFAGMAVTFQAEELTANSLSLTTMQVHPTAQKGIEFEHPLFTVYAPGSSEGDPDPVDSFSNVSQSVEPGSVASLGPGTVVLTNWVSGGKLSLNFEVASVIDPLGGEGGAGGGGPMGPCMALMAFTDNAEGPLDNNCTTCHGGNNTSATNAVDMSDIGTDASAACGQILNRVDLNNPAQSQLFITTDPNGNASHPYKFGGNAGNHDNFVNAVSQWITAEGAAQ